MQHYSIVAIIYNPKSTGASKRLAKQLQRQLRKRSPTQKVELIATKHAGHAQELAHDIASRYKRPLILSSSGDGGYHEVVNGVLSVTRKGVTPITGLLPAGNANDHYRELHSIDTVDAIVAQQEQYIDVLQFTVHAPGKPSTVQFAHSYIGVGLTPIAGNELNKARFKLMSEIWIVTKVLLFLSSVKLVVDGHVRYYDSLVFSNISRMSKILKIAQNASPSDGKFEVTAFRRRNKLQLITALWHASTRGLEGNRQVTDYSFETTQSTLVQLDGEIVRVGANSQVDIRIVPAALRCIV